ncbi:hypothetical protein PGN35_010820 [Nodosilinea sp. PGN35]|uniref:hypothetical protein n=1 Tax=Nodosilinea sp. PGN35 TaxID=3020489 RepID=UPI0023B26F7B|nr:hypothetical protein [Nodosilinea sp. TSF1-S3]MDF0366477.1 hypothetical protein [Nodosilinea sp. TSF1-S3]
MTSDFPDPIPSYLPIGLLEESITLYDGEIHFKQGENSFIANGQIRVAWLPTPRLQFEAINPLPEQIKSLAQREDLLLQLVDGKKISRGIITERKTGSRSTTLSGIIGEQVDWPTDVPINHVLFILPNFQKLVGMPIQFSDKTSSNRLELRHSGWVITLDAVENQDEVFKLLEFHHGFGVTHFGKLEREDGEDFNLEDFLSILEALNWYSSFAIGQWTGFCLPVGFSNSGEKIWQSWSLSKLGPFTRQSSWLGWGSRRNIFEESFSGFLELWHDENWQEIVKLAIHWYIEANSQRGSIEGSIILSQTALELLASAILVENSDLISAEEFDKSPAFEKIRGVLSWAQIPAEVPSDLPLLQEKWVDGAKAITEIRNKLTHPKKKNRKKFLLLSRDIKINAWKLSLLYLELVLLKLFKHQGRYANRIRRKFVGDTEQVPWIRDD